MANVSAGTAYVDVKLGRVEQFKREFKEEVEKAGSEGGKKSGEKFTDGFNETVTNRVKVKTKTSFEEVGKSGGTRAAATFGNTFAERVSRAVQISRNNVMAWLLPAFVAAGPFLGATLGSLIVAGLGAGVIGGGILLLSKDPRIDLAAKLVWMKFTNAATSAASPMIQPLLDVFADFQRRIPEFIKPIQGAFLSASNWIGPLGTSIQNALISILTGINNAMKNAGPIMQVFFSMIERVGAAIGDFFTKITADPEAVEGMADALEDLTGVIVFAINWLSAFIISAARAYAQFKDAWGAIKSWFSGTIVPSFKRAGDQLMGIVGAIGKFFSDWWNRLKSGFNGMNATFKTAMATFIATARTLLSNTVSTLTQLPGRIAAALSGLGSRLYSIGRDAMQGFLNGIGDMAGAVIGKARNLANTVVNTIKNALRIGSPSRVMMEIGRWTGEGFSLGLEDSMKAVRLPAPIAQVTGNFGDISAPQMDQASGVGGINVTNYVYGDVDPWRQAEDMYFMLTARGATVS